MSRPLRSVGTKVSTACPGNAPYSAGAMHTSMHTGYTHVCTHVHTSPHTRPVCFHTNALGVEPHTLIQLGPTPYRTKKKRAPFSRFRICGCERPNKWTCSNGFVASEVAKLVLGHFGFVAVETRRATANARTEVSSATKHLSTFWVSDILASVHSHKSGRCGTERPFFPLRGVLTCVVGFRGDCVGPGSVVEISNDVVRHERRP